MTKEEKARLREAFLFYLTQDSATKDARRKEFNQAIFMTDKMFYGCQVFNGTSLDMVLEKFDKAIKEMK